MDSNKDNSLPDEEIDDPANQEDYPETDDLDLEEDDQDIDINTTHSEEIPDGDDVNLERAE